MFCFCSGAFAKHSWVTDGFPMRWAGVTGRSDSVCLPIRLYMQSGSTFWQQTVMAHYFCFVLKEVNEQQTPTTSNKKRPPNSQRWSALLAAWSTPDWEMPHLLTSRKGRPEGVQEAKERSGSQRGRQQGLQQALRELQRGRVPGDHTLCYINSQISSLWKWRRQPKWSLEWCLCLEQVYI